MKKLNLFGKLHVIPNTIYEFLITTQNDKDANDPNYPYNIAPMGIEFNDEKTFYLRPFKNTKTYKNLLKNVHFTINVCQEVEIFYNCIFFKEYFKKDQFNLDEKTETPFLINSIASMTCKIISEKSISSERAQFECELESLVSWNEFCEPPCRARNLVLEALIHFTRLKIIKDGKRKEFLMKLIYEYQDIIKRISENETYVKIIDKIVERIKDF
ncbi:MAG: DUF447 family protein [Candidatus Lokiarchaeota archaeon]|nr:DUF447 family protein [Candidatus Lokiarchaeota archaeon]